MKNIFRYIEEKGYEPFEAAIEATKEIGLAVMATTLSLVVIFLPVGFMQSIPGRFFKSVSLTMAFAIMVSLLVSFTLDADAERAHAQAVETQSRRHR
ncbi:MAG: efflux RND transporter permease subunit [Acidobacteriota bacterium]